MPKPKDKHDEQHLKNVQLYLKRIQELYKIASDEASKIGCSINGVDSSKPFNFDDYPQTQKKMNALLSKFKKSLEVSIVNGIDAEWALSNSKNDEIVNKAFGSKKNKLTDEQKKRYFNNNEDAKDAFIERKRNGLSLSDSVWDFTKRFKSEIEMGLDLGIRSGKSADQMSRSLRDYLQNTNKLFRRYKDEHGILQLSKAAKAFHPGQGVYRSSYMNARRLAATETNIAYRTADHLRWKEMDFVVGIEIHLSNNHTCKGRDGKPHDFHDICDELQGKYPKDFKFTGWHPHCRCFVTSILKTPDELKSGKPSKNEVKELPSKFKEWYENNKERIDNAKSLPYFIKDNFKDGEFIGQKPLTTLEKAKIRQDARTKEQIADIQRRWDERKKNQLIRVAASKVLNVAKDYSEVDYSKLEAVIGSGDIKKISTLTREVAKAVSDMKKQEEDLSTIIPDVHEWHKKFAIDELKQTFSGVVKTLKSMPTDLEVRKVKLDFEIQWVEKHKKYPTWAVAKASYQKEFKRVERILEEREIKESVIKALRMADTSRSSVFKTLAIEMRSILSAPNYDLKVAREKADALIKKQKELEYRRKGAVKEAKIGASVPLKRETLKEMSLRLGKDLPKTLPNLDKAIKAYEKTSSYGTKAKKYKEDIEELMRKVFDKHDLGMNIKEEIIEKVLTSWFKNTFEVGGGNGYVGSFKTEGKIETDHERLIAAHKLFGISKDLKNKQLERKQYEKYGNLLDHNVIESLRHNTARMYGNVEVRFKKDKVLATWTAGDSLCKRWQPSLCSDPKSCSFDDSYKTPTTKNENIIDLSIFKEDHIYSYLELQFHGDLTIDCVDSLAFPYDLTNPRYTKEYSTALKWKKIGVKIYFITESGDLGQL